MTTYSKFTDNELMELGSLTDDGLTRELAWRLQSWLLWFDAWKLEYDSTKLAPAPCVGGVYAYTGAQITQGFVK